MDINFSGQLTDFEFKCSKILCAMTKWFIGDVMNFDTKGKRRTKKYPPKKILIHSPEYLHNIPQFNDGRIKKNSIFLTHENNLNYAIKLWEKYCNSKFKYDGIGGKKRKGYKRGAKNRLKIVDKLKDDFLCEGCFVIYPQLIQFKDMEQWSKRLLPNSSLVIIYAHITPTSTDKSKDAKQIEYNEEYKERLQRFGYELGFKMKTHSRLDYMYTENKKFRNFIKMKMKVNSLSAQFFEFLSHYSYISFELNQSPLLQKRTSEEDTRSRKRRKLQKRCHSLPIDSEDEIEVLNSSLEEEEEEG
jgi:hypothetical protein